MFVNVNRVLLLARRFLMLRFFKIETLIDFTFWPILDILLWGGVGAVLSGNNSQMLAVTLTSVMLMRSFLYGYFDVSINFLHEILSSNIINLFASPLTFKEWLISAMLSGLVTAAAVFTFITFVVWCVFGIFLLATGPILLVFLLPLLICSWAIGCIAVCVLTQLGAQGQRMERIIGWVFVPFMGVYYKLEVLPIWVQKISLFVPMSYIFNALRQYMLENIIAYKELLIGYAGSIIYFACGYIVCQLVFAQARRKGLATLESA